MEGRGPCRLTRRSISRRVPKAVEDYRSPKTLREALGRDEAGFHTAFQSRFGKAEWLKPYAVETLERLGKAGTGKLDVICPGFVADCLETLEEINMEAREAFLHAGGSTFNYIPCLNDDLGWVRALADITTRHLAGWPTQTAPDAAALVASKQAALALGAKD